MAAADFYELVQNFYVGFYGRPADPEGLEFWAQKADEEGWTSVRDAFATSDEAQNFVFTNPETGDPYSNEELVDNIYQNLFGRDADEAGSDFYVDKLESGEMSLDTIVHNIIDGAQGEDETVMGNKVEVANYFTDNLGEKEYGEDQIPEARALLEGRLTDVEEAEEAVDVFLADSFTLAEVYNLSLEDNLPADYELSDASITVDNLAVAAVVDVEGEVAGIYNSAANVDDLPELDFNYSLEDSFENLWDAPGVVEDAESYVLTNEEGFDFGNITQEQADLIEGAENYEEGYWEWGQTYTLTNSADDLTGNNGEDVFVAPLVQNDLGGVTNSLASGDMLDGKGGTDSLEADLIPESTFVGGQSPVVEPNTQSVENVFFQAQSGAVTVDAGNMSGMEQLWSDNSRSDLLVEDVRAYPEDMIIGMDGTDHNVSFDVDFDANVFGPREDIESSLTFQFVNQEDPATEMENFPVDGIRFDYEGETYNLEDGLSDAETFDEFGDAIEAALAELGLGDLEVEQTVFTDDEGNDGAQYVIKDPDGGTFTEPGINFDQEELSGSGELFWESFVGEPVVEDLPIETNVVLDNVGRMDVGGVLDIGGMSNKGVNVFNVEVVSSSWLTSMLSTSRSVDPDTGSFNHLETVNISHAEDGEGDLVIGSQLNAQTDVNPTDLPTGHRVATDGLIDVQTFDASDFEGAINLGASFTSEVYGRYLDDADETVQFEYLGGEGGNLFTFAFDDSTVAGDPQFALDVVGGSSDDRFNLEGSFDLENIALYGGEGEDTVEVQSSIGDTDESTPAAFESFETLILAGDSNINADMLTQDDDVELDVDSLIIATQGGVDSTITNLNAEETSLTISGKNQTLPSNENGDNDQFFGNIVVENLVDGDEEDALSIDLDNTARSTGQMTLASLLVTRDDGEDWATDTLNLLSTGRLDTSNVVQDVQAAGITELNLEGTQNLAVHVSDLAEDDAFEINGENLEGDLDLLVNGALLEENQDTISANEENDNILGLYGNLDDVTPTIEGFETLQFGLHEFGDFADLFNVGSMGAEGTIDLEDTEGVEEYVVAGMSGSLTLQNLSSTVTLGDPTSSTGQIMAPADTTLELVADDDSDGVLDLSVATNDDGEGLITGNPDGNLFQGNVTVDVQNFETVNVDIPQPGNSGNLDLQLDMLLDSDARDLNITGGAAEEDASVEPDSLELVTPLPTTLDTVDVTGYDGGFEASLDTFAGTDTEFVLDENDATINLKGEENTQQTVLSGFDPDATAASWGVGGAAELNNSEDATIEVTVLDTEGESETLSFNISEIEGNPGDSASDAVTLLQDLASAVNSQSDDQLDANVVYTYAGENYTSRAALADDSDDFEDSGEVEDALAFGSDGTGGQVGFGIEVVPAPDSEYIDDPAYNAIDAVTIQARNESGTIIFDTGDMTNNANPRMQTSDVEDETYTFTNEGDYNVELSFTESNEDSVWTVENFVTGKVDDEGELTNADNMTVLNLEDLGVTDENWEDELNISQDDVDGDGNADTVIASSDEDDAWSIVLDDVTVNQDEFEYSDGLFYFETEDDGPAPTPEALELIGSFPGDDATDVEVGTDLEMYFNQDVEAGAGNIGIFDTDGVVESIAVTSDQVTFDGDVVTIDPAADLSANSDYYVRVQDGAIVDLDGNAYSGITSPDTWNFTTADGGGDQTEVSADVGTAATAETLDAGDDDYLFTDDANVENNVVIENFAEGDNIEFSNASEGDYNFTNDGEDVMITYNNTSEGVLNEMQLLGAVDAGDLVYNEASFESAIGFDAVSYA